MVILMIDEASGGCWAFYWRKLAVMSWVEEGWWSTSLFLRRSEEDW